MESLCTHKIERVTTQVNGNSYDFLFIKEAFAGDVDFFTTQKGRKVLIQMGDVKIQNLGKDQQKRAQIPEGICQLELVSSDFHHFVFNSFFGGLERGV